MPTNEAGESHGGDARAAEHADGPLLDKLRDRGYIIDQSTEIQEYLDHRGANAATFLQGDLLLRPDPRKVEIIEEYLHNVQRRVGLVSKMSPRELEIHVKEFMVRHRKMLGISDADAGWLQCWLDSAQDV